MSCLDMLRAFGVSDAGRRVADEGLRIRGFVWDFDWKHRFAALLPLDRGPEAIAESAELVC